MSNKDSLSHTIKVVLGVSLVCSIVVSLAAVGLKPLQIANKIADTQKNILAVSGVDYIGKQLSKVYGDNIQVKLIDFSTGDFVAADKIKAATYDQRLASKDPEQSIKLTSAQDTAGILRRANYAPVYLVTNNGEVERYIFPIHGRGLWSTMYAFVALKADGNTIDAITYYDQGETPGLGGEVANPTWRALWEGKRLYDDTGMLAIKLVKGQAPKGDDYAVDALSGATLTGNGVQNSFNFWFGPDGFGPFLKKLQSQSNATQVEKINIVQPAALQSNEEPDLTQVTSSKEEG